MSGTKILDQIEIELRDIKTQHLQKVYIDVFDNGLSRKWLRALENLLKNNYMLEKNYCFFGFSKSLRDGPYLLNQINYSIQEINAANLGYKIDDFFCMSNTITDEDDGPHVQGRNIVHDKLNHLHRYFEDLQGVSGHMSKYYNRADSTTRWHIRQLNLLCHEFESWALSYRKDIQAPEWKRPSQLMCWLHAPRFILDEEDYELFGIETINRPLGGVFVGVNKAVGKHHWEVFVDEGRDSRIDELTTSTMRSQTEAAGDFDIEWANNPGEFVWQQIRLREFREWLVDNGFNPDDKKLTIGHPQVGQVDLQRSFGSDKYQDIWPILDTHLDVWSIKTTNSYIEYPYHWSDPDFIELQVNQIYQGN